MSNTRGNLLYAKDYDRRSQIIRAAAYHDPTTPCGMCGHTLDHHPPTRTGKPQTWDADHERPGDPTSPLRAVASSCNRAAGARDRNTRRTKLTTSRDW